MLSILLLIHLCHMNLTFKTFEEILIGKSRENFSYFEAKDRKIKVEILSIANVNKNFTNNVMDCDKIIGEYIFQTKFTRFMVIIDSVYDKIHRISFQSYSINKKGYNPLINGLYHNII